MRKQSPRRPLREYDQGHIFGAISAVMVATARLRAGVDGETAMALTLTTVIQAGLDLGIPGEILTRVTNDFAVKCGVGDLVSVSPPADAHD